MLPNTPTPYYLLEIPQELAHLLDEARREWIELRQRSRRTDVHLREAVELHVVVPKASHVRVPKVLIQERGKVGSKDQQ